MSYSILFHPKCKQEINKACRKNPILKKVLEKKIKDITLDPTHYKPLRYDLSGERRVHILKSFILRFDVDENKRIIKFLAFKHHDSAYKR